MTEKSPQTQTALYLLQLVSLTVVLSVLVKYFGKYLHIPAVPAVAIAMIAAPAAIVAIRLVWLESRES